MQAETGIEAGASIPDRGHSQETFTGRRLAAQFHSGLNTDDSEL
jgi:hypothetical protein